MIELRSDLRVLIVVSTFNRKDLTGQTLSSIARAKHPWSQVVILDDCSDEYGRDWLSMWGFPIHRRMKPIGVGLAARARLEFFTNLRKEFEFLVACDNDITVADLFDLKLRSVWERLRTEHPEDKMLLSGFSSVTYDIAEEQPYYNRVFKIGGACLFLDQKTADHLLTSLPDESWNGRWDNAVSEKVTGCYVPKKTLAQHHGNYGSGHNGPSWNVATNPDNEDEPRDI